MAGNDGKDRKRGKFSILKNSMRNLLLMGVASSSLPLSLFVPVFVPMAPVVNEAHAGVASFFANVLAEKGQASQSNGKYNSQNSSLGLEAPLSPKLAMVSAGASIVNSTALEYQQSEATGGPIQPDQISTYIVREDDTLSQIAKMFNVSVNTIVWANDINGGLITPGQDLIILPVTGVQHIVKAGDSLQSIAKQHDGNLEEILVFNGLSADAKLAVGDEIIVPNGDAAPTKPSSGVSGSSSKPNLAGYFMRPISGGKKTQGIHGYNGVDLAAPVGTKVVASAGGKVIVSRSFGYNGGYGNYAVVAHSNGTQTLYAHLNSVAVAQGATVSQGQTIGSVGNTGRSTGPHLHFEVRGAKNPF